MSEISNTNADLLRAERTNIPEVVFARYKDDESLLNSINALLPKDKVLVTKCTEKQISLLKSNYADRIKKSDEISGTVIVSDVENEQKNIGTIAILAAGTSDYFVSEEAGISAEFLGLKALRHYDCGVAGIHRINGAIESIDKNNVDVVIVVAGMEGALPSIVTGLIKQPIIAVPTSVGYGTSYGGVAALLSMLNSCSPGISVVNIDNGFGAAACAFKMIKWLRTLK